MPFCGAARICIAGSCAALLCALLAACGAPPSRPPGAQAPSEGAGAAGPPASTVFRLDPASSELRILVYRTGPMASLGHDHVIRGHALEGRATFDGRAAGAAFELTVPVDQFSVDDAPARAEEGAAFAEPVTDEARAGTMHNMLGPAVLNAAQFPQLTLRGVLVAGSGAAWQARVEVHVAGRAATLLVPFTLDATSQRLIAAGTATIRQSELGLTPFSVFLGALKVQDELTVKFKLVARKS